MANLTNTITTKAKDTAPACRLTAKLHTKWPSAPLVIEIPTLNRCPLVIDDFRQNLIQYAYAGAQAGFISLDGASAPTYVPPELLAEIKTALDTMKVDIDPKGMSYPIKLFIGLEEKTLIPSRPSASVTTLGWLTKGVDTLADAGIDCFLLVYPRGNVPELADLYRALTKELLSGSHPAVKLFNADIIHDPDDYQRADALTTSLHAAILNAFGPNGSHLDELRSMFSEHRKQGESTPIYIALNVNL